LISDESLAKLPINEWELYEDCPIWTTIVFSVAVFGGFLGSIGLVFEYGNK
jgi:hypothetical protein